MPLLKSLRKLACCAPGRREEEAEAPAGRARPEFAQAARPRPEFAQTARPRPEPAQAAAAEPGRPYGVFVENEAGKYWQDTVKAGRPAKPDRREIRAAALPILCRAQRRRPGWKIDPALNRAQMAVGVMHLHAAERGWIRPPYSRPQASPDYVEALIQLADDAGWLAREIPLPAHRGPQHPRIYFTVEPVSNRPVPRKDALIRADYVYDAADGCRITEDEYIRPWRDSDDPPSFNDLVSRDYPAFYTFYTLHTDAWAGHADSVPDRTMITYCWIKMVGGIPIVIRKPDRKVLLTPFGYKIMTGIHFSLHPPSWEDLHRYGRTRDQITRDLLWSTWPPVADL